MRHLKNNQGFTLIELVVSIGTAAVVMAAAAMFLLMGVRTQRDVLDASKEQQTLRTVFAMLENLASEGTIQKVEITESGWTLSDGTEGIVTYNAQTGVLNTNGTPILSGLNTAHAELNGKLLTFTFETDLQSYSSGVYCRLLPEITDSNGDGSTEDEKEAVGDISGILNNAQNPSGTLTDRASFIQALTKEYGSMGVSSTGVNFAQWYEPSWSANTPWCACYLSWVAAQQFGLDGRKTGSELHGLYPGTIFADVDDGWRDMAKPETPQPGDYVFFDWERNTVNNPDSSGVGDPDHVGVVIYTSGNTIFTIEGNSGGRVAIRSYDKRDYRIMGYRTLPWQCL